MMAELLDPSIETTFLSEERITGNQKWMCPFERLDRIESQLGTVTSQLGTFTTQLGKITTTIRMSILDQWSGYESHEGELSSLVYGGNVIEDYRIIRDMTHIKSNRADTWKRAFKAMYEAQYLTCVNHQLESAPEQIHNVMNIVASVKSRFAWTETKNDDKERDRGYIVDKGIRIIQQWVAQGESLFVNDPDTLALYNQVQELYSKY
jgi:hypothetical protein